MKKLFPPMMNCLGTGHVFCIFVYWLCGIVLFPMWMPLIGYGLWDNYRAISWVELVYHGVNALVMILVMKEYLVDSFFEVRYNTKPILKTVATACELMLAWGLIGSFLFGQMWAIDWFPLAEMEVALTAGFMVENNPIFGTLCMTFLVPFGICGMFYATGFGPMGCKAPKFAYLTVAVVLLIPCVFDIIWRGEAWFSIPAFILRLPVHLIACWSYQKTDNVWTPIFALAAFNLFGSIVCTLV